MSRSAQQHRHRWSWEARLGARCVTAEGTFLVVRQRGTDNSRICASSFLSFLHPSPSFCPFRCGSSVCMRSTTMRLRGSFSCTSLGARSTISLASHQAHSFCGPGGEPHRPPSPQRRGCSGHFKASCDPFTAMVSTHTHTHTSCLCQHVVIGSVKHNARARAPSLD